MKKKFTHIPFAIKIALLGGLIIVGKLNQVSNRAPVVIAQKHVAADTSNRTVYSPVVPVKKVIFRQTNQ